jgi:dUTPase-like protein
VDRLAEMLLGQRQLQERLGHNFETMSHAERLAYVKEMYVAATLELGEALNETTWKSWTVGDPHINILPFISELSDAWQFIANMWFAALPFATPGQVADAMRETLLTKLQVNHRRADDDYDGVSTKCPQCKRALDDPHVMCSADHCIIATQTTRVSSS